MAVDSLRSLNAALGAGGMVERASGLVVPVALATQPEAPLAETLDADGLARVVLTAEERKKLIAAADVLEERGFKLAIRCQRHPVAITRATRRRVVAPRKDACGGELRPSTEGGAAECLCARLHFR